MRNDELPLLIKGSHEAVGVFLDFISLEHQLS
jgi:hypothetical protein